MVFGHPVSGITELFGTLGEIDGMVQGVTHGATGRDGGEVKDGQRYGPHHSPRALLVVHQLPHEVGAVAVRPVPDPAVDDPYDSTLDGRRPGVCPPDDPA